MENFNNLVMRVAMKLCYGSEAEAHSDLVAEGVSTEMAHFVVRAAALMVSYNLV